VGEQALESIDREGFGAMLRSQSAGMSEEALDEYWKAYTEDDRRRGQLEMYRSGDFSKLEPYEGCLAALGVPVLVLWGGEDRFSAARMADRFVAEIPDAERVVLDGVGHFIWEDAPEPTCRALVEFLERRVRRA
jgi:haloalkane dehalogenase